MWCVVNFIIIFCVHFSYKFLAPKTTELAFWFEILAAKILYEKRSQKMLMKLTPTQHSFAPLSNLFLKLDRFRYQEEKLKKGENFTTLSRLELDEEGFNRILRIQEKKLFIFFVCSDFKRMITL